MLTFQRFLLLPALLFALPGLAASANDNLRPSVQIRDGIARAHLCHALSALQIQAHRGAADRPENMISAFLRGAELGTDVVEMDLQFSRDNQVIVAHDPFLRAECLDSDGVPLGRRRVLIHDLTLEEIRRYDCGSNVKAGITAVPGERTPTLAEVLEALRPVRTRRGLPLGLNIEMKYDANHPEYFPSREAYVHLMLQVLDAGGIEPSRLLIQSFDVPILAVLRQQRPQLKVSPLLSDATHGVEIARDLGAETVTPNIDQITPERVAAFHAMKPAVRVIPWTVNSPDVAVRMINDGVDGAITDHPDLFIRLAQDLCGDAVTASAASL